MENGETGRLIVIRNSNMIAHREPCLESDDPAKREQANLEWIVKMLGSIREDKQCVKVGLMQCEGLFRPLQLPQRARAVVKIPNLCGSRIPPHPTRRAGEHADAQSDRSRSDLADARRVPWWFSTPLGIVHRFLNPESVIIFEHERRTAKGRRPLSSRLQPIARRESEVGEHDRGGTINSALRYTSISTSSPVPRRLKYTMKHDIFSLGVCLLEIALWRSIFTERASSPDSDSKELLIFDKEGQYSFLDSIEIGDELRQEQSERFHPAKDKTPTDPSQERIAHRRRERLVAYAKKEIPPLMGTDVL